MLSNKRAILFDFDGTLAPNLDLPGMRRDVTAHALDTGVPASVIEGQNIIEIIETAAGWMQESGWQNETADNYVRDANQIILDIELGAAAETSPFPGVRELLKQLNDRGIVSGIVTRNCRDAVLQTFPDVMDFVRVLHARDDVEFVKPDPRHLTDTLTQLQAEPAQAVMVGDGAMDMKVGRQVGMTCVGVLTGSADEALLRESGAHHILEDCLALVSDGLPNRK